MSGLLALMLLVHARHRARTGADGSLIPMAEQDRARWDRTAIQEGVALITAALPRGPTGPYQLQAAIAAVHDEASSAQTTDWAQIAALYELLLRLDDNPVVAVNHAVAVSMVSGPGAGFELLRTLESDTRMSGNRRFHAVRAQLLERDGNPAAALAAYQAAARQSALTRSAAAIRARLAALVIASAAHDTLANLMYATACPPARVSSRPSCRRRTDVLRRHIYLHLTNDWFADQYRRAAALIDADQKDVTAMIAAQEAAGR